MERDRNSTEGLLQLRTRREDLCQCNSRTDESGLCRDGSPLAGVELTGLPGDPCTDAAGFYTATVSCGWSGTVTAQKDCYSFQPAERTYTNVGSDQPDQDYAATGLTYTISGTVTADGSPVAGVRMTGLPGDPCTDSAGYYTATVGCGWSGTVTPQKDCYSFQPAERTYTNVGSDHTGQDYAAQALTYTISGTVTADGSPLAGVRLTGLPGDPCTDSAGFYTATVGCGCSGTVRPAGPGLRRCTAAV